MIKVLFAGSPEAARLTLERLYEVQSACDFEIAGVLSNPPSAKGRHKDLIPTPVAANLRTAIPTPVVANLKMVILILVAMNRKTTIPSPVTVNLKTVVPVTKIKILHQGNRTKACQAQRLNSFGVR